jgi:tetratricopeptide (TPR) repeat protein
MSRLSALLLCVACLWAGGCQRKEALLADGLTTEEAQEICLEKPGGGLPLDDEIRRHQTQARALGGKPDEWIYVGRGWVRKARLSGDPGFYVNVRGCVDAALKVAPSNAAALELHGLALMNDHKFTEAREVAERTLAIDSKNVIALGTLSDALLELGRFDEAVVAAQKMVDIKPNMASYGRAAYLRWLGGDAAGAKQLMQYALTARDIRDPEPAAWSFVQAATIYWHEGDYDGADAVFQAALKWVAEYPPALIGRARVALAKGEPEWAVKYLERANRVTRLPETAWLLGDAREMQGDTARAARHYEEAIAEGKRSDPLMLALFLTTKNRSVGDALRVIEAERSRRGGVYVEDAYAWALYRTGRIAEAREASDRALRLRTPDPRLLYHAGAIRLAAGDIQGRDLVRKALALNPQFDRTGAIEAAGLLDATGPFAAAQ